MTDSFSKFIGVSALGHVAVTVALLMHAYLAPSEPIDLREAIRVDVVGLPQKDQSLPEPVPAPAKAPPVAATPKPQPKPKAPAPPKVNLKGKKADKQVAKEEKSALEKIKEMEALEKIQHDVSNHPVKKIAGNVVHAGNSLTGLDKIDYDRYFHDIEQRVQANWSLPQWLMDAHLRAQALVLIDESGSIKKKKVIRSSGNAEFDARMMDAIDKAAPFPAPPGRLRDVLSIKGIVFSFPQRGDS